MMELAKREWGQALAGMSGERIKFAIDFVKSECKYPPVIADFVGAAREYRAPVTVEPRSLLDPPSPKTQAGTHAGMQLMRNVMKQLSKGQGRRVLPHGHPEYEAELRACKETGELPYDVDMRWLARQGWTEALDAEWRGHCKNLGWTVERMYPAGHEPSEL